MSRRSERASRKRAASESVEPGTGDLQHVGGEQHSPNPSAAEAPKPSVVHFPPTCLADFVVHYRGTAFHVHKLTLHYHSSYFRTYIDQLVDGQRAYSTEECGDHPSVAHCIRLPDSCGKVEASAEDFQLFLCHLYFAHHYSCIPYQVAAHIDLTAQPPPPVRHEYSIGSLQQLMRATPATSFGTNTAPAVYESVLSLCHYFDCSLVLERAESNMLLFFDGAEPHNTQSQWYVLWWCFLLAHKFDLLQVKTACVQTLAARSSHVSGNISVPALERARGQLDEGTLFDLLRASMRHFSRF